MQQWFAAKEIITLPKVLLCGLKTRTCLNNELSPSTAKISATISQYWAIAMANKIANLKYPLQSYSVYTNYASDEYGEYDYFYGQEVSSVANIPDKFTSLEIPSAKMVKFTTKPGVMPALVINAWQNIWKMNEADLGGKRSYQSDFEVYDERALDMSNAVINVYVGIK